MDEATYIHLLNLITPMIRIVSFVVADCIFIDFATEDDLVEIERPRTIMDLFLVGKHIYIFTGSSFSKTSRYI